MSEQNQRPNTYTLTAEGIQAAEQEWMPEAAAGLVKFGVDANSGRLIVIPKDEQFISLFNSNRAFRTPREAEAAVENKGPTRTVGGIMAGNILSPRGQYSVFGADPVRAAQGGLPGKAADLGQDALEVAGTYGPLTAIATSRNVGRLSIGKLAGMAGGAKLLASGINSALGSGRGDELYNEDPRNVLMTAGADAVAAAMYKRFGSKKQQVARELDALINQSMRNPKGTPVPEETRRHVLEGIKMDRPYTFQDWTRQPLTDLELARPDLKKLPVMYDKLSLPMETEVKPLKHGKRVTNDVARAWAEKNGIDINTYGLENVRKGLEEIYSEEGLGRAAFWPTKKDKPMTQEQYTIWAHSLRNDNPFLYDLASNRVHIVGDTELDKQWAEAKAASGQRHSKAVDVVRDATQTDANRGRARGGAMGSTPIVTQKQGEGLAAKGKFKRGAAKIGAFLLPTATEALGYKVLED